MPKETWRVPLRLSIDAQEAAITVRARFSDFARSADNRGWEILNATDGGRKLLVKGFDPIRPGQLDQEATEAITRQLAEALQERRYSQVQDSASEGSAEGHRWTHYVHPFVRRYWHGEGVPNVGLEKEVASEIVSALKSDTYIDLDKFKGRILQHFYETRGIKKSLEVLGPKRLVFLDAVNFASTFSGYATLAGVLDAMSREGYKQHLHDPEIGPPEKANLDALAQEGYLSRTGSRFRLKRFLRDWFEARPEENIFA